MLLLLLSQKYDDDTNLIGYRLLGDDMGHRFLRKLVHTPSRHTPFPRFGRHGRYESPKNTTWSGELKLVFQTIEDLHKSVPSSLGDWYFTGDYPTAGGYKVLNRAFINYYEQRNERSY